MSVLTSQQKQKQLIKKYFNLLVKEFITDSRHNKDISIVFQDYLESSEKTTTLGYTRQLTNKNEQSKTTWQEINGVKVPGSEKTTTTITYAYKYIITFLSNYENEDDLRGCVVHEFTHLYLYSKIGEHDHDDRFYSTMEYLENWLNQNQGLIPRADKSHDRDQYKNDNNSESEDKENTCPECFFSNPHHSPQCPHNQDNPRSIKQPKPRQETNDPQKAVEFDHLKNLLKNSQNLATLESNYQNIKSDPLYKGENCNDNKKTLDSLYDWQKYYLKSSTNKPNSSLNKGGMESREYFLIILAIVGIAFAIIIVGYLIMSENQNSARPKKKRN